MNRTPNEKAAKTASALLQLAGEYRQEGKPDVAQKLEEGATTLPVGSLARLHDIMMAA